MPTVDWDLFNISFCVYAFLDTGVLHLLSIQIVPKPVLKQVPHKPMRKFSRRLGLLISLAKNVFKVSLLPQTF